MDRLPIDAGGGNIYSSAEQYMMCCKANLVGDSRSASLIMESRSPAEQQRLGRRVKWAIFGGVGFSQAGGGL